MRQAGAIEGDPLWYKDAVIYELHVRGFKDSNADGVGDFRGLIEKLDYLQDLGVTALCLLPFYPSPLRDDGYDIADFTAVHAAYGALRDVKQFVREAHRRGLRVIYELVCNHTSDQHPWFQRARRARPGTSHRGFYVWSDTAERYRDARVIFGDFEQSNWSWDPVAQAYYWHRFFKHQPDLNFGHPGVQRAVLKALDFWFGMGWDGVRLDAVPYLCEREGTSCANLPETHAFLKQLRRHVDERFPDRLLLAEANQWPEDAAAYFGDGDECHMNLHFPLMPRLYTALRMEDRFPIVDILERTPPIPRTCQWALFLRNHDALTLEMVTDEERDYMYRVYAADPQLRVNVGIRRRLAPLVDGSRRRLELLNALLFSLPGTPVLYYGDEIGMGDNPYLGDRNGVRTPMQWSPDRNAGFSAANPQRLYLPVIVEPEYHYQTVNVAAQQHNPSSLLWWMKRLSALRKRHRALSRGQIEFLQPDNHRVLAFLRRYDDEQILVVANLSRFVQHAELDLSAFRGMVPVEMFGQSPFPPIGDRPLFLTLAPHTFLWLSLERGRPVGARASPAAPPPTLALGVPLREIVRGRERSRLAGVLGAYLPTRPWFGAGGRVRSVEVVDAVPLGQREDDAFAALARVERAEGEPDTHVILLAGAWGEAAEHLERACPDAVVGRIEPDALLYDALVGRTTATAVALLETVGGRRRLRGAGPGEVEGVPGPAFRSLRRAAGAPEPILARVERSNTAVAVGDRFVLKLFHRLEPGVHPEPELLGFLTERGFSHASPLVGTLVYRRGRTVAATLGLLRGHVANQGTAWQHALDGLDRYFEVALASPAVAVGPVSAAGLLSARQDEVPPEVRGVLGGLGGWASLLGQRTAELHRVLGSAPDAPDFAPEPFSELYQRALHQTMHSQVARAWRLLRSRFGGPPAPDQALARRVLEAGPDVERSFGLLLGRRIAALRIRVHGDYRLGRLLWTGNDFAVADFEGDPTRPLGERRLKRCALRDVAEMLRSFHRAWRFALAEQAARGLVRAGDVAALEPWGRAWQRYVSAAFLRGYRDACRGSGLVPDEASELEPLLDAYLLRGAVLELARPTEEHPDGGAVALEGILQALGRTA